MSDQIGLNFDEENHTQRDNQKDNSLESKVKNSDTTFNTLKSVSPKTSQYSEEYIKNEWAKDYYIFDVRDYESIGKPEWKNWPKEITRETVTEMVNKRSFINSGHSSYLIEIMIKEYGWTEERIVDYVLKLKEKHLNTLKNEWRNSIVNPQIGFKENIKYLKEVYSYYLCCCKNLNENPESFESLISKIKAGKQND